MKLAQIKTNLQSKKTSLLAGLFIIASSLSFISGCGSSSGTVADNNNKLNNAIVVEKTAAIPILDGKATSTGIYIRNTTGETISGVSYALAQTNSRTSLTINSASCNTIAANSSCLLPVTIPALSLGGSGSNIVVASYNGQQSKQLINYRYVNNQEYSGVNFSDNSQTLFGTNDYATVYVFVGKGQSQNSVGFNTSNSSLAIRHGLTNGKTDIPANTVVPLEIQSNQNVTANLVTVTPYIQTTSKNLQNALASGVQNNSQLQVTISPTQQANLLMSDVPVLTQSESTVTLTIVNNGNQTANTINLTSASSDVTVTAAISNPCSGTLTSGASCNYTLKLINRNSNGSALLTLAYNNIITDTQATQTVYFLNNSSEPMVAAVATQTNFSEQSNTNQNITFNISNLGNAPLNSAAITTRTTLAHTTLSIINNTCSSNIAANGSCSLEVNVAASGLIDSGVIYLNISGAYTGTATKSYSFMSKPVYATIIDTNDPTVTSTTPQDTATSVSTSSGIVVNFSEPMTAITLSNSNIQLQKVSDNSSIALTSQGVSNNNQTVAFSQTSGTLADNTQYKIVINPSQIKDINGNTMSAASSQIVATFTTGDTTPPTISSFNPANGAINLSQAPTINLTFSESMDQSTLTTANIILQTQSGTTVSGYTLSYNPTTYTATINLNGNLLTSQITYQLLVNQQNLKDISGSAMGSNSSYQVSQFTIGDYTAPTLSSTVPTNGATSVAVESAISLTFSEAMDTSTLTTANIQLQKASDSSNISLNVPTYSNGNQTVTFQPTATLTAGESYNIVINPSAIKDVAGNAMSASTTQTVSNFTTKSANPFVLVGSYPISNGVIGADQTTVTMTFNRTVNISTVNSATISVVKTGVGNNLINSCNLVNESMVACSLSSNLNNNANYTYTITTGVKSLDNVSLAAETVINFSTIYISAQQRLASGSSFACMLNSYGQAYCWGLNVYGALGNGTYLNESSPQLVLNGDIPVGVPLITISAGTSLQGSGAACGISSAAKAYCWGDNRYFAIGSGESIESYNVPKAVATKATNLLSAIPADAKITAIDGGNLETCALDSNGDAYCWGNVGTIQPNNVNIDGYLGDAVGTRASNVAIKVDQSVSGAFKQISVGGGYACGVNTDDQAYCWGNNKNSQLGNGNSTSQKTPTLVLAGEIPINNKIISLSVSKDDTISSSVLVTCAIVDNGKAYCWGNNSKGQLGINSTTNKNIPTQVFTSESDSSSAITNNTILTSISAGSTYVCALDSMGNTYCWGNNNLGQLGIGSLSQKKTAQLVITGGSSAIPVGVGLQSVIAGYDNGITTPVSQPALTCGLGTDNNFYCWGDNKAGQVGVNTSVRYYSSAQKVLLP